MRQHLLRPVALLGAATVGLTVLGFSAPAEGSRAVTTARSAVDTDCPTPSDAVVDGRGSSSGGDSYFAADGNGGYDVQSYKIKDTYRPGTDKLTGRTLVTLKAREDLDRFNLDLVLAADKVVVDGEAAQFSKPSSHELRVTPAHQVAQGDTVVVRVDYAGKPSEKASEGMVPGSDLYFHGRGETVAMGEPQNGAWWFAANETPADTATFDITLRVPTGTQAVSNGTQRSSTSEGGWTTRRWTVAKPIVTYLVFFAVGDLDVRTGKAGGRPYTYAVSRLLSAQQQANALTTLQETPEVVGWLEDQFGDYPYGAIGGVVSGLGAPYALETATRPVYPYLGSPGESATSYVVHENAHQWFGDDVALCRWKDVWLNEGFATYAEWLWTEDHGGSSVNQILHARYAGHTGAFWQVKVSDPGPDDMWGSSVYQRGGMMLAALRHRIGDTDFTALLRAWVQQQGGGHGTGTEFRALAEQVSGEDLDGFFTAWLDNQAQPAATADNGLD